MAGPITWRNVGGGGGGNAASFLNMGQQQIQQGLATLSGLVKDTAKADDAAFAAERDNNTNKYLDAVQAAGGLEALQNPEIRAQLEAQRAGYGGAIDHAATRNAIDAQVTALQRAASVGNAYQDQQAERGQRGVVDQLYQLAASGDKAGAQKILDENELFDEGNIRKNITGTFDAATNRLYAAEDQARQGRQETRSAAQFAETMANAKENRADRQLARQERRDANYLTAMDAQLKDQEAALRAGNPLANTEKDPYKAANESVDKVAKELSPWFSFDTYAVGRVKDRVASYMGDGLDVKGVGKVKLPKAAMDQLLGEMTGKIYRSADTMMEDMDTMVKAFATNNAGAFRKAGETTTALEKIRASQKVVADSRIRLLKGESLDSETISATLNSARKKAPNLNFLPEREEDNRVANQ